MIFAGFALVVAVLFMIFFKNPREDNQPTAAEVIEQAKEDIDGAGMIDVE